LEEITLEVPVHIQVMPAGLTEEEMKSSFLNTSFLNIVITENTVVVVALQLVFFPFEKIPCV